jgi:hypothetical protein
MYEFDEYEKFPLIGKISPGACLGRRINRHLCPCCGGSCGVRKALNKFSRYHKGVRIGDTTNYPDTMMTKWNHKSSGYKAKHKKNQRETIRY